MQNINKRACRKYADPHLYFDPNNGLLYAEKLDYLVRSAVKRIGGQRLLLLYLYDRKKAANGDFIPFMTIFQGKEDFCNLVRKEDGELVWRRSSFEKLFGWWSPKSLAFYTAKDEARVKRFCNQPELSGEKAMKKYQEPILTARAKQKALAREKEIKAVMDTVPKLTRREKSWLKKKLLPQYVFYDYSRKGPNNCHCTACGHDVELPAAKHLQQGICPHCGCAVTFRARGKSKRVWDRETGQIIHRTADGNIVVRLFKADQIFGNGVRNTSIRESARFFVSACESDHMVEQYYDSYYNGTLTTWKIGMRPQFSYWQYNFENDPCGFLYLENLPEALFGTPWQYSQIEAFASSGRKLVALNYLWQYEKYPAIEYLVKMGLYRLTEDIVSRKSGYDGVPQGLSLRESKPELILGVPKQYFHILRKLDVGSGGLSVCQALSACGITVGVEEIIRWCEEREISDSGSLTIPLYYMTPHRWMKYVTEQALQRKRSGFLYQNPDNRVRQTASDYRDYLEMCENCGIDLSSSYHLFPQNLTERHNSLVELNRAAVKEARDRKIQELFPVLQKKYGWERNGWLVVPPRDAAEISAEAGALHHCVNTYISRVAEMSTVILFIRRSSDPKKPCFTMEVKHGGIAQVRGFKNCDPTEEVNDFLSEWEKRVLYRIPAFCEEDGNEGETPIAA